MNTDAASLIIQLAGVFVPVVRQAIEDHKAQNNGQEPTNEQIIAQFADDIQRYLDEGAAWKKGHPTKERS